MQRHFGCTGSLNFSYPITRTYPFAWFTWVVIVGGIILTILFSFIAVAANGYILNPIYTTDLNATLASRHWFQKPPFSWAAKVQVSCQGAALTPGVQVFTSNLGLMYTIDRMWQQTDDGQEKFVPAVAYRNSPLEKCSVTQIYMDFLRRDNTPIPKNHWSWSHTSASATALCTMNTDTGPVYALFLVQLPQVKNMGGILTNFISLNSSSHLNMWFGAQFLVRWYSHLSTSMGYQYKVGDDGYTSGNVALSRNSNTSDFMSPAFFSVDATFTNDRGGLFYMHSDKNYTMSNWNEQLNIPSDQQPFQLPNNSITVDTFGKLFYSLVLSDFGSTDNTNALLTEAGIKYLQSRNDTDVYKQAKDMGEEQDMGQPASGIQNIHNSDKERYGLSSAYEKVTAAFGGSVPNLNTTVTSTVFTQYLCAVPKMKDGGSLFFTVLIADLVFLNVCWVILNWGAQFYLKKKDPQMDFCAGCVASRSVTNISRVCDVENSSTKNRNRGSSQYALLPVKEQNVVIGQDEVDIGGSSAVRTR